MSKAADQKFLLLVTGLAGSGKTTALHVLEDLGFASIDNLPLRLIPNLLSDPEALPDRMVLGLDVRELDPDAFATALEDIRANPAVAAHLLFLFAEPDELLRRFRETRRRHPLAVGRPLEESIALEEGLMGALRQLADSELDTTRFAPADLARIIKERFSPDNPPGLSVYVMSFGFKHGLPREVDMVFDVRYLNNPHWEPELKPRTGQDPTVRAYIEADPEFAEGFGNIHRLVTHQLTQFARLDRAYVTIGVGCTGGKHRSVMVAEKLAATLAEDGFNVRLHHRDMTKATS